MQLKGVLFLASQTTRSQAYAQAMVAHKLEPERVLVFGGINAKQGPSLGNDNVSLSRSEGLAFPNLSISLSETCRLAKWKSEELSTSQVNDVAISNFVRALKPRLVIYSGFGGQLVGTELLEIGAPFLHIHSGWLPEERGSTTIYYSLLQGHECSASAIILDKGIDTGAIVARQRFARPPAGTDVDCMYDNAIRACLLVEVLEVFQKTGKLPEHIPQSPHAGTTHYVIHPVLKHIALLSLE